MSRITKFKDVLRRHALWLGLIAVAIPLIVHLLLQYKSLSNLQSTWPHAHRAYMRRYLSNVADKVNRYYEEGALETLNVPSEVFYHEYPDPKFDYDVVNTAVNRQIVHSYFSTHPFNGARLLFVGTMASPNDQNYAIVRFYDPVACSFSQKVLWQERMAAHAAAANWMGMLMVNYTPYLKSIKLTIDERDPKNRIIVRPIVNEKYQIVGVAGMFLNERAFIKENLASAIRESLPADFPEKYQDVVVTVISKDDKLVYSNQPFEGRAYDVTLPLSFIFTDYSLGIRMRTMTEDQLISRYFWTNLSFSILTALVLIGGIILTLHAASHAMKLSQMKADFVSNVSHELRTPLASIRVFGEFLKLGRVKEQSKIHEYGEYIETESRRLSQLINNILDFSKIESGQKTYQFERSDIEHVVSDTLKTFEVLLEQYGFKIRYSKPASALPPVVMDPNAIAQALINLLDNAVKYSTAEKEIDVRLRRENDFVTISVSDHGIGIAREDCDKVFDKFYRVGNCLVHDVKGSGLGLSIVKHIVEAHQGKVTVESELGRGSTFGIHLPHDENSKARIEADRQDSENMNRLLGQDLQPGSQS